MNIFNRDYAVVSVSGVVLMESHSKERCDQYVAEARAEGAAEWECRVVKSDCPRDAVK
jgi:hypothetical protein